MRILLALFLLLPFCSSAAFTEFYVQTSGNNLNSGSTSDDSPTYTAAGGFWTNSTGVWRKDGETLTGVTNGSWASIYPDASTTNVFVGMVTNVTTTNIWISLVAKTGTSPADDTAGATTIRVGGAWKGPQLLYLAANTNDSMHPFGFVSQQMTNTPLNVARVNFKAETYYVTNTISSLSNGAIVWSGYATTPGDGGKAVINGTTSGVGYILMQISGVNNYISDFIFDGNGSSGSPGGAVRASGAEQVWVNCVVRNMRQNGLSTGASPLLFIGIEAYSNNIANSSSQGGISDSSTVCTFIRCYSHDNIGANSYGFFLSGNNVMLNCIASNNGGVGVNNTGGNIATIIGCDVYNNGSHGITLSSTANNATVLQNCNFFKNGGSGIASAGSTAYKNGMIQNCVFGTGTETNTFGSFSSTQPSGIVVSGSIDYGADSNPWINASGGNFSIKPTATTKASGIGSFLYYGTNGLSVSYPDIGAAQSASTNTTASGGTTAHTFAQ